MEPLTELSTGSGKRNPKTSERIARRLVNYIVDNDLAEGTLLPTEKELVQAFGVGRTTLREALRLLETRGVITIRPGPGGDPVVRRPRPDDLREGLTLFLQFSGASLNDVLEARAALEPMMARLAAERITPEQIDELQATIDNMRGSLGDHDLFLRENQRFHGIIAEATGSVVLLTFNDSLKSIADGASVGVHYTARRHSAVATAHQAIVDALRKGDSAAAEEAMLRHLDEAGDYWRRKYSNLTSSAVRWIH